MLTAPSRSWPELRALFEEAWQRRRSRHRRVGGVLLLGACVAAAFVAARDGRQGSGQTGRQAALPALVLSGAPGIGVACPAAPNSIACDRVGIAVSLPTRHARLRATVAGRSVQLHNRATGACPRTGCFYSGYLRHAGLVDGALRVQPDQGRYHWYGHHPVTATIRLTATYPDGTRAQTVRHAPLSPGWG
ncbi:MAG: hypothetical protein QOJ63_3262 [Solirubrobacteraceae bacterium]|nr:hypothetical protein [Solirubrobacteraceae bacterium]